MSEENPASMQQRIANYLRLSIAGYVTLCMGLSLLGLTIVTWVVFNAEPQRVAWGDYIRWPQMLFLVGLIAAICFLTYWTVRLWNEDLPVRERNLELAWQAGIEGLRKQGVAIDELPLFLVVGCQQEKAQESFLQQAGLRLTTEPIPKASSSPVRWYIAADRILLFLGDVGTFSAIQSRLSLHRQDEIAACNAAKLQLYGRAELSHSTEDLNEVNVAQQSILTRRRMDSSEPRSVARHSLVGSIPSQNADDSEGFGNHVAGPNRSPQENDDSLDPTSLMSDEQMLESLEATEKLLVDYDTELPPGENESKTPALPRQNPNAILSSKEIVRQQSLLEDTCRRLKVARTNTAPINGIIAWVDAPQLLDCTRLSRQCGLALRRDFTQIQEHLGVLAPVTVVLDRMQEMDGFSELVRRTGQEKSMTSLLGESTELQCLPETAIVKNTCRRSIAEVTSAIYRCFRSANGLGQPGNHKLFQLLIACRGTLGPTLESFLIEALAVRPTFTMAQEPAIFGGVYFTASGEKPTQHGFSNQILARMMDQQEFLSWTKGRLSLEKRYRFATWVLSGACLVLSVMLVAQIMIAAMW